MTTIRQLPRRAKLTNRLCLCLVTLTAVLFGIGLAVGKGLAGHYLLYAGICTVSLVPVVLIIGARPLWCPECNGFLRVREDHPRARESHIYYCKPCDVIWDTSIERGSN